MAKVVFLLILAASYVLGVHALNNLATNQEQHLASFYTATGDPQRLLSASPDQADWLHR